MKWNEDYSKTYLKHYAEDETISMAFKLANIESGECVLDLGCGSGFGLKNLDKKNCTLLGLDPSWNMLSYANKCEDQKITYIQAYGEYLPLRNNLVDVIISSNTIHFWSNMSLCLREMWRVLKPKGRLVLSEDDWHKNRKSLDFCEYTRLNKKHVQKTILESGFLFSKPILHLKHNKRLAVIMGIRRG